MSSKIIYLSILERNDSGKYQLLFCVAFLFNNKFFPFFFVRCEECGKRFTKSHHLKQHQNVHLREQGKQPINTYSRRKESRMAKVSTSVYLDYGEQKIEVEMVP
jgi:uncharacterized protein with PIN domain